jgi:DNA invertase Pin-like site-specific DNA recombinase
MTKIGYIRVSSIDQNLDRQLIKMNDLQVEKIFQEKVSGKDTDRPEFQKLINYAREGDILYFDSLDRLGRDYDDIKETVLYFRSNNIEVNFLDAPFLNFNTGNVLLDKAMFDMFLSLLSYIAQNEREKIRERQRQGIAAAKEKGIYKGRQTVYTEDSPDPQKRIVYQNILSMLAAGDPVTKISKKNHVSRETVYKIKRKRENSASESDSETISE